METVEGIDIEVFSTIEDVKYMSQGKGVRISYKGTIITSNTERSTVKNLKKCLSELCELL